MTDPAELPKLTPLPTPTAELRRMELRSARKAARTGLRIFADWLKKAGAAADEVEALRGAWRAIPPPE